MRVFPPADNNAPLADNRAPPLTPFHRTMLFWWYKDIDKSSLRVLKNCMRPYVLHRASSNFSEPKYVTKYQDCKEVAFI